MTNASNLVMPKLGLTMTEGTITEWCVQPGQTFEVGQIIAVVETEKITNEIEAPDSGSMTEHIVADGETVTVGAPMARWSLKGGGEPDTSTPSEPARSASTVANASSSLPIPQAQAQQRSAGSSRSRIVATPLARRIARENGMDLGSISGNGPGGRIKAADVSHAHASRHHDAVTGVKDASARFIIANIDAREALSLLKKLAPTFEKAPPKLIHIVCLAVARALSDHPDANKIAHKNGSYTQGQSTNIGLINMKSGDPPVFLLRCTPSTSLSEIIDNAAHLKDRPQTSTHDDADGSSTAIADANGQNNSYVSFPVPPGYSATLGLGASQEIFKPDTNERPALVREVGLVLTYDPAAMNNSAAVDFLSAIKGHLEKPLRLLAG